MTMWKNQNWERQYKERLGNEVFSFLEKDQNLIEYLSDYKYIWQALRPQAKKWQLTDNSLLVLTICKIFEGVLYLISHEMDWFNKYNNGQTPDSIRGFILKHRKDIEAEINSNAQLALNQKQDIKDKFFSIVNDFKERHEAVHYGSMLKIGEIENYDAILTKIKELVSIFLDNGLIKNE